ncbi:MAG: hypothetical protein GYA59_02460 [Chloroflexi bacterium]|nr:hypothetical protein [Chloroflexota bacterium]
MNKIRTYFERSWFYPLVLLLVMLVAYGLSLARLGFYWDDWQVVYLSRFKDLSVYWNYFLNDRPTSAWTYILTVPLLGMSALRWQLFTLVMRWLSVLGFCWALQGLWPRRTWQIRWMGLLLAVFPGFTQQTVSVAYSQHFITYALFTFSLGWMIWAVRRPQRFWLYTALALVAELGHLLTMEYFVGLELLRPVLLALLLSQSGEPLGRSALKALKRWLPYLAVLGVFLVYRFVIYPGFSPVPDGNPPVLLLQMLSEPLTALLRLVEHALQDSVHVLLFVWANTIEPSQIVLTAKTLLLSWVIGLLVALGIAWYASQGTDEAAAENGSDGFVRQGLLVGVLGILLGGLPVWITDRQVIVGLWSDRFSLAPMFGAVILLVWLVDWLSDRTRRKALFLGLLLGLAVASQVRTVNKYRLYWDIQRDYYWQLFWRAPALQPGTAVIGPEMPFSLVGDYSIGFALNALYAPELTSSQVPYWFINGGRYRGGAIIPDYKPGLPMKYDLRNMVFEGNTSQAIVVTYNNARGCLRVLDPIYAGVLPMSSGDADLLPLANTSAILAQPVSDQLPPRDIFGSEPPHTWCYYYQKADLARQLGDWQQAADLGAQAEAQGYAANNGAELLPFIEAYAHTGQWDKALSATQVAGQLTEKMQAPLCAAWERIAAGVESSPEASAAYQQAAAELKCGSLGVTEGRAGTTP